MLDQSIKRLKGVGEARATLLNKIGIYTIKDILEWYPREYEDFRNIKSIAELKPGEKGIFTGVLASAVQESRASGKLSVQKIKCRDATGTIMLVWFNRPYLKRVLFKGKKYILYGMVKSGRLGLEAHNCGFEEAGKDADIRYGSIIPVYRLTEGLSQKIVRELVKQAVQYFEDDKGEFLSKHMLAVYGLPDLKTALLSIHFPESMEDLNRARNRLIFNELLILQLGMIFMQNINKSKRNGITFCKSEETYRFIETLPFKLTSSQERVFADIEDDMGKDSGMNRLVHGDTGSGKTVVALLGMVKAHFNGYQSALMVPSEILAEQHYKNISGFLKNTEIISVMLTGSVQGKEREEVLEKIRNRKASIIIGTHALIQEGVVFNNLGLIVTDEQHRFGVRQRAQLSAKGSNPDMLVMTATPIPRTLALTLYGDLDISCIFEKPAGRKAVKTYAVDDTMRERINNLIIKEVRQGKQVYIVCPVIDEGGDTQITSAEEYYKNVSGGIFKEYKTALIHGRIKNYESEKIMRECAEGKIDILIATTVIEVGIDVPNASLIVVENAERFGLSQLHQLRGRVGRGSGQSYCILYNQSNSEVSRRRMEVMQATDDGFIIAQKDLELRGPGEFLGIRQHGLPAMKIADLGRDNEIAELTHTAAMEILSDDERLEREENNKIRLEVERHYKSIESLNRLQA